MIERETKAELYDENFCDLRGNPAFLSLARANDEQLATLENALDEFLTVQKTVHQRPEVWLKDALKDVLSGREGTWSLLLERTNDELGKEDVRLAARHLDGIQLNLPSGESRQKMLADAQKVKDHLQAGGKWNPLWGPTKGRGYLKSIDINGQRIKNAADLKTLVHSLGFDAKLETLWHLWENYTLSHAGLRERQVAELQEHLKALTLVFEVSDKVANAKTLLETCEFAMPSTDWSSDRPKELRETLKAVRAERALSEARAPITKVTTLLETYSQEPGAHPISQRFLDALEARDTAAWSVAVAELEGLERDRKRYEHAKKLQDRLSATALDAAKSLAETYQDEVWDVRLEKFEAAWVWAQVRDWLEAREEPGLQQRLEREQKEAEEEIQSLTAHLASEKAWQEFMSRLNTKQSQSLQAWRLAVKKIGKGTGKNAAKFQAEARAYMNDCIDAIPAWVMPRYRLTEMLPVQPEMFDVVIVDEASQTGIDGLFLYYLGKKVIVVGDDEQISPSDVGIPMAAVLALLKPLDGIPFKAALTPTHSLYDHANIRFGGKVVLREHFRCMPEIIEFSNRLSYAPNGTPLIPLRNYLPDRLQPVLTRYVEEGYQEGSSGKSRNIPEAEAIVTQIATCLEDPRYGGKTFGVISLLGDTQADLISQMLIQEVGPEVMEERRLICGNAYTFQGDERDVIFLSLVSAPAPDKRIGALTGQSAKQRFNVAASRAKDQMWLFHSAKLEDLSSNPDCVRRNLLAYCLNPSAPSVTISGIDVKDLRERTNDPYRSDKPPHPFDSWFEVRVFLQIAERGYKVVPQVEFAGYRLDLVVEGGQGRLAIECDGDRWHGLEQYDRDMARQRQLERSGWEFFRVRESAYNLDSGMVLEKLWKELDKRSIYPGFSKAPIVHVLHSEAVEQTSLVTMLESPPDNTREVRKEDEEPLLAPVENSSTKDADIVSHKVSVKDAEKLPTETDPTNFANNVDFAKEENEQVQESSSSVRQEIAEATELAAKNTADEDVRYTLNIPAETWFSLSHWAKVNDHFEGWERKILYSVGVRRSREIEPSKKQSRHAARLYKHARKAGFEPE